MEAILDQGLAVHQRPPVVGRACAARPPCAGGCGTHGKTTTTSMLAWILESAGLTPGFLVGGVPLNFGVSARLGDVAPGQQRPLFVIEADEYDTAFFDKRSKFVHYRPRTAVLNNLKLTTPTSFPIWRPLSGSFNTCCAPCPPLGAWSAMVWKRPWPASCTKAVGARCAALAVPSATFTAQGPHHAFAVLHAGQVVGQVQWGLSGEHNQLQCPGGHCGGRACGRAPRHSLCRLGGLSKCAPSDGVAWHGGRYCAVRRFCPPPHRHSDNLGWAAPANWPAKAHLGGL